MAHCLARLIKSLKRTELQPRRKHDTTSLCTTSGFPSRTLLITEQQPRTCGRSIHCREAPLRKDPRCLVADLQYIRSKFFLNRGIHGPDAESLTNIVSKHICIGGEELLLPPNTVASHSGSQQQCRNHNSEASFFFFFHEMLC